MKLKPITINLDDYPMELRLYLEGANLYDSSCSPDARVIFIDKDTGYFLKIGRVADLSREYEMTRYFHSKGLAADVIAYHFDIGHDYLLTEKIQGDDCTTTNIWSNRSDLLSCLVSAFDFCTVWITPIVQCQTIPSAIF